ncbi:MAG: class I SAM-dependent methyltransferase [Phycisphaeraceae bacterium]
MPPPSDSYLHPYREAADSHGHGFRVTLWASPKSQRRRFEVFAQMAPLVGKRILDAGCSRGDFAAYLAEHDIRYARFIGIDGLESVITYANQRNLPDAEFHAGDFVSDPSLLRLGDPQAIVISGTLNTMNNRTVRRTLEAAWDAAGEMLLFNFLSNRTGPDAPPQGKPARRLDTMWLLDWALSRTWAVQFRQDYFDQGHDATILMRKA